MQFMRQFISGLKGPGIIEVEVYDQGEDDPRPSFLIVERAEFRVLQNEQFFGSYVPIDPRHEDFYNMYVGVSSKGSILNRIGDHKRNPPDGIDGWMFAIIVKGYFDNSEYHHITEDEAKALEHLLYERLIRHEEIKLTNRQSPKEPTLSFSPKSDTDPLKLYEEASRLKDIFNKFQWFVEPTIELIETNLGYSVHGKRKSAVEELADLINGGQLKIEEKLYTSPRAIKFFAEAKIAPNLGYIEVIKHGKNSQDSEWQYDSEKTTYPKPFLDIHAAAELVSENRDIDGWDFWFNSDGIKLKNIKDSKG